MGLVSAAAGAVGGTLADQWRDFFVAPTFDEQTIVAPGVFQESNRGRGSNRSASANVISDGSRVVVPESTAVIVTDGGEIASVSTEPGYFEYFNDGQPSIFTGSGLRESLIRQSWERFKSGGSRLSSSSSTTSICGRSGTSDSAHQGYFPTETSHLFQKAPARRPFCV